MPIGRSRPLTKACTSSSGAAQPKSPPSSATKPSSDVIAEEINLAMAALPRATDGIFCTVIMSIGSDPAGATSLSRDVTERAR